MSCTIQSVLQQHFDSYAAQHRLPLQQRKAAKALMSCRTAALGGHVQRGEAGDLAGVWFNSRRHRYCPRCTPLRSMGTLALYRCSAFVPRGKIS